jgi:hypothetical protein
MLFLLALLWSLLLLLDDDEFASSPQSCDPNKMDLLLLELLQLDSSSFIIRKS